MHWWFVTITPLHGTPITLPLGNFTHIQTMEKGFAIGFLTITSFGHLMYSLPKFAFKIDYLYESLCFFVAT